MTTSEIPTESKLLENLKRLEDIWPYMENLRHRAHDELYIQGRQNDEFFAICICGDSQCRNLAKLMMPDEDYNENLDQGLEPILAGIVSWNRFELISKLVPGFTASLGDKPHKGMVRLVVIYQKSVSVFDIKPEPKTGLH